MLKPGEKTYYCGKCEKSFQAEDLILKKEKGEICSDCNDFHCPVCGGKVRMEKTTIITK